MYIDEDGGGGGGEGRSVTYNCYPGKKSVSFQYRNYVFTCFNSFAEKQQAYYKYVDNTESVKRNVRHTCICIDLYIYINVLIPLLKNSITIM